MEGFSVQLERDPENQKFRLAWVSESVTSSAPFLHREYVFETSPDLIEWTTLEEVTTGGAFPEASRQLDRTLPATGDRLFVRVSARLNLPGADLRDFDLSGADLRGANLAGTDLTGADLTGAILDGADLSGARLDGTLLAGARLIETRMDEVDLDGLNLAQVDLGGIIGAARLSRLPGDPDADAALVMPALGFEGSPEDMAANDPDLPCLGVSIRHAMVMLKPGVTVAEVNQLVEKYNAVIVGCEPADQWFGRGVLMLEFPSSSVLALYKETESLRNESIVAASARAARRRGGLGG